MAQDFQVGVGGSYKEVTQQDAVQVGVGGVWKVVSAMYVGVGGVWKQFYENVLASWSTGGDISETGEAYNVTVTSASRTCTVTNGPIDLTVSGASGTALMSVAGGSFLSGTQSVSNGQSIRLRLTTANDPLTERIATVTGNGDTLNYSVTTGDFGG